MFIRAIISVSLFAACILAADTPLTPAEVRLNEAKQAVNKSPKSAAVHAALADLLLTRARDLSDASLLPLAQSEIDKALALEHDSFDALKAQCALMMMRHEYAAALDLARSLHKRTPDDVMVHGLIVDAAIGVGEYKEAEQQAQWMFDLRPGNIPAFLRGAELRCLFGDPEGALEFLNQALRRIRLEDAEPRAYILSRISHMFLMRGDIAAATRTANQALAVMPQSILSMRALAAAKMASSDYTGAAELLVKTSRSLDGLPDSYELAICLEKSGQADAASSVYANFERAAHAVTNQPANANPALVAYYLDHAHKPADALAIAEHQAAATHDWRSLERLAWSLQANGRTDEASQMMNQAKAVGIRDKDLLAHSALIQPVKTN